MLVSSKESTWEIAETCKIGFRTVYCITKTWKDHTEPSSSRNKCGLKKSLLIVIKKSNSNKKRKIEKKEKLRKKDLLTKSRCIVTMTIKTLCL